MAAVQTRATAPAGHAAGSRRTTGVAHAATSPTPNGAAVPTSPRRSSASPWLNRPTAANTTTATASAAAASRVIREDGAAMDI